MVAFGKPHLYKPDAPAVLMATHRQIIGMLVIPLRPHIRHSRIFCERHGQFCPYVVIDRKAPDGRPLAVHAAHLIPLQDFPLHELITDDATPRTKEKVR